MTLMNELVISPESGFIQEHMGWDRRRADGFGSLGCGDLQRGVASRKKQELSPWQAPGRPALGHPLPLKIFPVSEMTLVLFFYWPYCSILLTETAVLGREAQVSSRNWSFLIRTTNLKTLSSC